MNNSKTTYQKIELNEFYKNHFINPIGTDKINGILVHTIVRFKHFPGSLIVSSVHLVNLFNVDTTLEKLINVAKDILSPQKTNELSNRLKEMNKLSSTDLRRFTSVIASEMSISTPYSLKKIIIYTIYNLLCKRL